MDLPGLDIRRVAFFGGTFDPPHRGHLAVARAAQRALRLDAVLFAPVGAQPLKPQGTTASFEERVDMTRLAIEGDPTFTVSLIDAPSASGAPNYTIETLTNLRNSFPFDAELYCLMGADSFLALHHWHRGAEIPFVAPLIVASRPGQSLDDLAAALPGGLTISDQPVPAEEPTSVDLRVYTLRNAAGLTTPFFLLPGLHIAISASDVRAQVRSATGKPATGQDHNLSQQPLLDGLRNLLPDAVAAYIAARGLYR